MSTEIQTTASTPMPEPVLDPTEVRRQRGLDIAARSRITFQNGRWLVPCQSKEGHYHVNLNPNASAIPMCDCPDYEERGEPCKHVYAVRFVISHEVAPDGTITQTKTMTVSETTTITPARPTYKQNWPAYNAAQTNEKARFLVLLHDLCQGIEEPPAPVGQRGRPRNLMRDMVFAVAYKVYTTVSVRRFQSDLDDAAAKGYLAKSPHYNSVTNYLEDERLTPILRGLIIESSLPLKAVEVDFAVDSTGFMSSRFSRWYDHKYGKFMKRHDWVKVHLMTGVKTNVVTAVEIKDKDAGDAPMLPALLGETAKGFTVREVSADKAYLSLENTDAIAKVGATPYIIMKKNTTGAMGGTFHDMYHAFCLNKDEFLNHYHKRSNVESTVSMIKAKFGDAVRSKTDVAMANEALCKILCHNLCCLISAIYELGIDVSFGVDDEIGEPTNDAMGDAGQPEPEPAEPISPVEAWDWV